MHTHPSDPEELIPLLEKFYGGEFVLKKGRGRDTLVFHGKIDRVVVPVPSQKTIVIHTSIVFERTIGCKANQSPTKRWKETDLPSGKLVFPYSWFYPQPKHERLKLEFVPKKDGDKKSKKKSAEEESTHDRCWLCSHTDPIYLDLFRTMLMRMFLEESVRKESMWRRFRDRIMS